MPDTIQAPKLAELIAGDFYSSRFDLSAREISSHAGWSVMPEVERTGRLRKLGATDRTIRVFLTLVSAMDRARDATRLWRNAVRLFESHPEIFDPTQVTSMTRKALSDLLSQSRVSQRHGPDADAWCDIATSLTFGAGAVKRLVDTGTGEVQELLRDLRRRDSAGRARYPLLKGPKISAMWVRIMAEPGGADIRGIETLPVAVDVHVRRASDNLGVTETRGLDMVDATLEVQQAWQEAVRDARIGGPERIAGTCAALDPALWFFGKNGCSHCERIGRRAPINRACENCRLPD